MSLNSLRWDGSPGHYEVYYLAFTDPQSEVGIWIRYTLHVPVSGLDLPPTCAVWFMAMDPVRGERVAHKETFSAQELTVSETPFCLQIGESLLSDTELRGAVADCTWDIALTPAGDGAYELVHPFLQKLPLNKNVYTVPHVGLKASGVVEIAGKRIKLQAAHGSQAHLWGSKHAPRWAWMHVGDLLDEDGNSVPNTFLEGVSGYIQRFGREIGPFTPIVGRFFDEEFIANHPLQITRAKTAFESTFWRGEVRQGKRKVNFHLQAKVDNLVGVTYHDPDGEKLYCYNTEVADASIQVWDKVTNSQVSSWKLRATYSSKGKAHFEYAQREHLHGFTIHVN